MNARTLRGLYVGRYQPFHNGHLHASEYILERADQLLIAIGSAQYSHTARNPFTAGERVSMVYEAMDGEGMDRSRYMVIPVPDVHVHSLWVKHLVTYLPTFEIVYTNEPLVRRLFHEDGRFPVEAIPFFEREMLSATEVRRRMLEHGEWAALVPGRVAEYIRKIDGVSRVREVASTDVRERAP